jgi:hypothetical protein
MTNSAAKSNKQLQSRSSIRLESKTIFNDYSNLKMNNTVSGFGLMPKGVTEEDFLDTENSIDDKNFKSGIKVNTKYGTSLRMAMDTLDLIPEFEESGIEGENAKKLHNTNLFKKPETAINKKVNYLNKNNFDNKNYKNNRNNNNSNNSNIQNNEDLEEINKFNNAILKNAHWGEAGKPGHSEESAKNYLFHKPDKKEIEREIGKSIYNTKLPRARLLTKIKDPGSNSFSKLANKTGGAFGSNVKTKVFGDITDYDHSAFNKTAFNEKSLKKK